MFIPIGLIARLASGAVDSRDDAAALQFESNVQARDFELELMRQSKRAQELWGACTGATGALLVLTDNDWANTEIDHVRVSGVSSTSPPSGYRETADPLGAGPHGLFAVCPGRHTIRTTVGGDLIDTDVTLFPGEAGFRRLDRASRTWSRYEVAMQEKLLERVAATQLSLLHYYEYVGDLRMKAMVGKSADEAVGESMVLLRATLEAIVRGDENGALQRVALVSRTLVGAPLRSFAPITSFVGFNAFELFGKSKPREAWLLLQAGLAILPDDPTILAALGEIQLRTGSVEEGKATLRRALERRGGLDHALSARVDELVA